MSLLNLGLQCVRLMRKEMPTQYEKAVMNCYCMAEIRKVSSGSAFVDAVLDSFSSCIVLLANGSPCCAEIVQIVM